MHTKYILSVWHTNESIRWWVFHDIHTFGLNDSVKRWLNFILKNIIFLIIRKRQSTYYLKNFGMIDQMGIMCNIESSFASCKTFQPIKLSFDCLQRDFKTLLSNHNKTYMKKFITIEAGIEAYWFKPITMNYRMRVLKF